MQRISLLVALVVTLGYSAVTAGPAFGQSSGTVGAKVAVLAGGACMTLSNTAIDYGSSLLATTTTERTVQGPGNPDFTATSCTIQPQNLLIRGTDATGGGATWALGSGSTCQAGPNQYGHLSHSSYWGYQWLTTTDQVTGHLGAQGQGADNVHFNTALYMACEGSGGVGQVMTTDILLTVVPQ